ncbi:nucleolar GTP-binding protein 1 [Pelomyxa schiedti]|nr:nucleolar GTP-binding protein 1 [Pelomyxa schiedti]
MVLYNFKRITVVPPGSEFIDVVLSSTQSKTPTVIHKHYAIPRIRAFYIRKVRFVQQTYHDRLSLILEEFPVLDDLHPFYADLLNVLYDKDHYKIALAQLATARRLIDNIGKEYVRFLKYGDSLYRCKQLKRSAVGRMCTLIRQQSPSLAYLEQVRQHLARLPSIDPTTRTILITGYPNVGKSSLMNKLTNANVDVQPYAFTTKSLFVGHMDYKYLRWQVIDSPGILDHPLEDRNTIEMQAITALAHLRAAVLFVIDISTACGYTIRQQVSLFESLKPLFTNKPVVLLLNKIDMMKYDTLPVEDRTLIESLVKSTELPNHKLPILQMSTLTEIGIAEAKAQARLSNQQYISYLILLQVCDILLELRTEGKKKTGALLDRLHLAAPARRDSQARPPCIPPSVARARVKAEELKAAVASGELPPKLTKAQIEVAHLDWENDVLSIGKQPWEERMSDRESYILENPAWKYDVIPEIMDGKNIIDFIDPDIVARLEELEKEEDVAMEMRRRELNLDKDVPLTTEQLEKYRDIMHKRKMKRYLHAINQHSRSHATSMLTNVKRSSTHLSKHLTDLGADSADANVAAKGAARSSSTKRKRTAKSLEVRFLETDRKRRRGLSKCDRHHENVENRERSLTPAPGAGFKDVKARLGTIKSDFREKKKWSRVAKVGEGDRRIDTKKPKHLFSGKRKAGKTQRR